jgi:uncharacterized protein YecE (DUF72 family)
MNDVPPRLHFGTMGFGYADWAGVFYPPGTRPGDYLSHYARHFDTVELDTTFHAVPPIDRVRRWADVTPDGFRFCVKTPRDITHEGSLDRRIDLMRHFLSVMRAFGPKLAVVLVQLPPSCGVDQFESLEHFLGALPDDVRFAVEFRNASWGQQRTLDLLRAHRAALVFAEYLTRPRRILVTSDQLYIRWIGEHERFQELNHEQLDVTPNLEWWKQELQRTCEASPASAGGSSAVRDVWGFFNNDYSGYSIATCRRFMRLMNLPVPAEEDLAGQGRLFQ